MRYFLTKQTKVGSRLWINRREVYILLGADMIHFFPKLDHTVEKLSLYMSFLTG